MSVLDKLLLPSKHLNVPVYTTLTTTSMLMRMFKSYLGALYSSKVPPGIQSTP